MSQFKSQVEVIVEPTKSGFAFRIEHKGRVVRCGVAKKQDSAYRYAQTQLRAFLKARTLTCNPYAI